MATMMISSTQLRSRARELEDLNKQFDTQVRALEEKEQALKSMYEGEAATEFHNAFSQDKIQMNNFFNCIARYIAVLEKIAERMERAERENRDTARRRSYK